MTYEEITEEINVYMNVSRLECSLKPLVYNILRSIIPSGNTIVDISEAGWNNSYTKQFYVRSNGQFVNKTRASKFRPRGSYCDLVIISDVKPAEKYKDTCKKKCAVELIWTGQKFEDKDYIARVIAYSKAFGYAIYTNGLDWQIYKSGKLTNEINLNKEKDLKSLNEHITEMFN